MHAWEAHSPTDPTLAADSSWSDYGANLESIVEVALTRKRAEHPEVKVDYEVVRGAPVRALVERSEGATLLVVGSRGSGGFEGLHVGSTAMQLMGRSQARS